MPHSSNANYFFSCVVSSLKRSARVTEEINMNHNPTFMCALCSVSTRECEARTPNSAVCVTLPQPCDGNGSEIFGKLTSATRNLKCPSLQKKKGQRGGDTDKWLVIAVQNAYRKFCNKNCCCCARDNLQNRGKPACKLRLFIGYLKNKKIIYATGC